MAKQWTHRERWASARSKVWEAVNVLVGSGPIDKRLAHANIYLGHLRMDRALVEGMPEEARTLFSHISKRMDAHRRGGQDDYGAVELDEREADKLAGDVLSLYTKLNDGI